MSLADLLYDNDGEKPDVYEVILFFTRHHLIKNENMAGHEGHYQQVDNILKVIIKKALIELTKYQIFKLCLSVYLHDMGQRVNDISLNGFTLADSEARYNNFNKRLEEYLIISKNIKIDGEVSLSILLNNDIRDLCLGHTDYIDIEGKQFINKMKDEDKPLIYLLRFAELIVQLDQRETTQCPELCYKDYPSWVLTTLQRCWPEEFKTIKFKCCYDLVNYGKRISFESESLKINISIGNDLLNDDISKFLYTAYIFQFNKEKKSMEKLFRRYHAIKKIELSYDKTIEDKFSIMCKAFCNNSKLKKIYGDYSVFLNNEIIKDKSSPTQQFSKEWLDSKLSIVSGDYLLDIFNDGKRTLAEYKITMLQRIENKTSSYIELIYDDVLLIKYWEKGNSIGSIQLKSTDDLMFTLYYSMEFWCNDYEKWYQIDSDAIKRELEEIAIGTTCFNIGSSGNT